MAIAFRAGAGNEVGSAGGATTLTVTLGGAALAGSALLVYVKWFCNTTQPATDLSVPTGYTVVDRGTYDGNSNVAVFYKVAVGGETNVVLSWPGHTADVFASAVLLEYTGTHISAPVDVYGIAIGTYTTPAVTVVNGSALLPMYSVVDPNTATGDYTPAGGVTERQEFAGTATVSRHIEVGDVACSPGVSSTYAATYNHSGALGPFYGPAASALVLRANTAPTAPILGAPANATTANLAAGGTFSWTFGDPDAGDTQSAFAIRRKVGAGAYEYYNAGTGTWGAVEVFNTSTTQAITFPASKWTTGTTYLWSISCKDSVGLAGPYATDSQVKASTPPVVVVTLPTGTYTTSSLPTVAWTYTDGESDVQASYRLRVFSAAQYGIGGFDPATSPATYDSGTVAGAGLTAAVGTALANGVTYRAYVMATETGGQPSAWAFNTFTLALDTPALPLLSASYDAAFNRVALTVTGRDNMLTANQASIETNTTGLAANTNCTIARSTAQFANGAASLSMTSVAAGDMQAITSGGTSGVPCTPGQLLCALASFRSAVSARTVRVDIAFYNAAGTFLSTVFGAVGLADTTSAFTQGFCFATAPASAAFYNVAFSVLATGAASEVHYVDMISGTPDSIANMAPNPMMDSLSPWNTSISGGTIGLDATLSLIFGSQVIRFTQTTPSVVARFGVGTAVASMIPVLAGTTYNVSAHGWPLVYNRDLGFFISYYDSAAVLLSAVQPGSTACPFNAWTRFSSVITTPASTAFMAIRFQAPFAGGNINAAGDAFAIAGVQTTAGAALQPFVPSRVWTRGGLVGVSTYSVERSVDAGLTWKTVRGSGLVLPTPPTAATFYDREALPSSTARYRAYAKADV